ncbi:exodeoxyribonuclease VII large subunit [Petrocella sp. FN5]|uniref:exodeoxyribonuclease VII large subunit n=1 Tax=Petrocella sp. FN5 TaxID=3032002 RepID=UPI0023DA0D52|nr:exodeoxyribonuclease VII large subunit [Petrocella sp. FN5]MDF1617015.1 exodeoxyribonuclease VII large subunit [Petrocella sp. FN5]
MEKQVLKVSHVNAYIKQLMDKDFILKNLSVQGEISNYKAHSSGHLYFTLKDDESTISCIMFRTHVQNLGFEVENGMKIIVQGAVSVYERSGQYQIYVRKIMQDGLGQLYQAFEELKKKLSREGLFDEAAKKPICKYAGHIGIITSDTGAAIRDIVQVAKRRNPYIKMTLYPALVQGPDAAQTIIKGIGYFNQEQKVDTIILGRGGGSIEDLWVFNEEDVARSIYASDIPIISAVGHETDFTISDFVADLRAPTPSAAAELAVYDYYTLQNNLNQYDLTLRQAMYRQLDYKKKRLELLKIQLSHEHPGLKYERKYQYITELEDKIKMRMENILRKKKHQVNLLEEQLKGLSPIQRLKEGYAYLSDLQLNKVTSVNQLNPNDKVMLTLSDGQVIANVDVIEYNKGDA